MENELVRAGDLGWAALGGCGCRVVRMGMFIYLAVLLIGRRLQSR